MKQILLLLTLVYSHQLFAEVKPWGLGVILHNPTGFSVKHRLSAQNSIDAALGYSIGKSDNLSIHATYLWEFNEEIKISKAYLGYYFGIGGSLYSRDRDKDPPRWAENNRDDDFGIAVRGSGGLNYYFKEPAIEVFVELALNFFFIPSTDLDLGAGVGGRFYF